MFAARNRVTNSKCTAMGVAGAQVSSIPVEHVRPCISYVGRTRKSVSFTPVRDVLCSLSQTIQRVEHAKRLIARKEVKICMDEQYRRLYPIGTEIGAYGGVFLWSLPRLDADVLWGAGRGLISCVLTN